MDGSHHKFDSLQLFLSHHTKSAGPRVSDIQKTLQKAENSFSFCSNPLYGPLGVRVIKSNETEIHTARSKNQSLCQHNSTLSTAFSPGSILIDSMIDADLEKRNSAPDLDVKRTNKIRTTTTLTPNKGHTIRKSTFARRHTQLVNSPSNKTDPGLFRKDSFLSARSTYSPNSRFGSTKSRRHQEKEEDKSLVEESESFLMIQPLCVETNNNDPESPVFQRQKLSLGLDKDIFPQSIISYANSIYATSFSSNIKDLILYASKEKNKNGEFHALRPKQEALFSVLLKGKARDAFERLLLELSLKLKEESVSFRQKYKGDIDFFEAKMLKAIRSPNASVKFEEKELEMMIDKISILMDEKYLIVCYASLKLVRNYIQNLLGKLKSPITSQSANTETLVSAENITLPKLLEKATTSHEDSTYYRDIVIFTYDLYISPQNLILYLIFRYFIPKPLNMSRAELKLFQAKSTNKTKSLLLSVLIFWLEEREADFLRAPSLLTILSSFLEIAQASEKDVNLTKQFQDLWKLHQNAISKVIRKERKTNASVSINEEADSNRSFDGVDSKFDSTLFDSQKMRRKQQKVNKAPGLFSFCKQNISKAQYSLDKFLGESVNNIAQQLTLLDWKQFSDIGLREVLNKRWTKEDKRECPNYWIHVKRFNSFSFWIQYLILSQECPTKRMTLAEKFLKVAMICINDYKNYCSSNYIFSGLFSLCNFEVINFENELKRDYEQLQSIFAPNGGYIKLYNEFFKDLKPPAIPNLNIFLRIFLKLQDGVNFWVSLPESRVKYLKFQSLVQIYDYCREMKRFQKVCFDGISKNVNLYSFLKTGFQEMIPVDILTPEDMLKKITQMAGPTKKPQSKLFRFFGLKNN